MKGVLKLLILLFFGQAVQAQIVNIPDANFKAKLLADYDANADGEIQQSEAESIQFLGLGPGNITDLTGIQSLTNLITLDCSENQITSLDLSGLTNLQHLGCWDNQITSINLTGCVNLKVLQCGNNLISGTLDLSNLQYLEDLTCYNNLITSLNASNCPNLVICSIEDNPGLAYIDVSNCPNLTDSIDGVYPNLISFNLANCSSIGQLHITNANLLQTLNLSGCSGLTILDIDYQSGNQLQNFDVSGCTALQLLVIYGTTPLTTISLSGLSGLQEFYIPDQPYLNAVDFTGCLNLETVTLYNNAALSAVDFSTCPALKDLNVSHCQLANLDVSANFNLQTVYCNNNDIHTLLAKNGANETINFSNNPNLTFVCVDEAQVATVQADLNTAGLTSVVCNSYCSFSPGGNYNTLEGTVRFDSDANGCDVQDNPVSYLRININDGTSTTAVFSNEMGHFRKYVLSGDYSITPVIENTDAFVISPQTAAVSFPDNNNHVFVQDFCMAVVPPQNDIEVIIMPVTPARPGFNANYRIVYKNKGNTTLSGNVVFNYNDAILDFVSSSPLPFTLTEGTVTWDFTDLAPLQTRTIYFTLHVNSPLDTPPVVIGDQLDFTASINPVLNDETPEDNVFNYKQIVVGSYDPNNIECLEGDTVATDYIGQYLHYVVNFENTGNYPTENIVVRIEIDPTKYDINTLQLLTTSHEVYAVITGNVIEFIFEQVQLDSGGHGNILFKLKTNPSLANGDVVSKRADIFFDYNAPVDTGMASTLFQTLNTGDPVDVSLSVYPNPSNGLVNISGQYEIKSVQLYDIQGRLLQTQVTSATQATLDISNQASGVYFVKITTEAGSKVERIIRE